MAVLHKLKLKRPSDQIPFQVFMPENEYTRRLAEIRKARRSAMFSGKVFEVMQQPKLRRRDLVVWNPTGSPGLWRVTDISTWRDPADMDYASMEVAMNATSDSMANEMANEVDDDILAQLGVKVVRRTIPRGKVRLEWEGGWSGYCDDRLPVVVKIEEVCLANEMEALAIAAL